MRTQVPQNLEEFRIRASRLLKALGDETPAIALDAAKRFRILPQWFEQSPERIYQARESIRRKHALAVIAKESGFKDWPALKSAYCMAEETGFDTTRLFLKTAAFLNFWFRDYDEARQVLTNEPRRFLFPHRQHFVVCEGGLLEALGVDIGDPDWERMGRDWVKPADRRARARLAVRLRRAMGNR